MINIDVLAIGSFQRDEDGNVFDAHSNSTLIRTEDRRIVVDTSTKHMLPAIKTSFKQIGVFPKDVDTVILTHSHQDHVGNNDLFPNAEIMLHSAEENKVPKAVLFEKEIQIAKGIRIVHTPGHTKGSVSVFIDADQKYVIAGDAVPRYANYEKKIPPVINFDPETALESIKLITKYADIIVPGHDPPFITKK
jgi:Zn-dependent hydrolases, including glyoxylases